MFVVGTLDEIHAEIIADRGNRFPNADVSKFSANWKNDRVTAMAALGLHAHIDSIYEDLMADGAAGARLDRIGAVHNVIRKAATVAQKAAALRLVGTVGAAFTAGQQLAYQPDATLYALNSSGVIPAGGYIDADVISVDKGSKAKKQKGQVLTFLSAPAGIQSQAELQLDVDLGGANVEDDGTYRVRILDKIAQPGMGGNAHDYQVWALSQTGVDTAYVYPLRQGLGSVDLAFLHAGRGSARIPIAGEISDLQAYLDTVRPVSVADFRVLTVAAEPKDVEITVTPIDGPQYAFDWDDTIPTTVAAWTGATRILQFTARPPGIAVGDRVIYKSTGAPYGDGSELVVEAIGPGANEVTVKTLNTAQALGPPVAGNTTYSGGPLVQPVRLALLALYDSLGPGRGTDATKVSGLWEDKLRVSTLFKIAQTADGVLDSTVIVPGANVAPANAPPSATIGVITPRQVIVRRG